jgi:hypothetical protein
MRDVARFLAAVAFLSLSIPAMSSEACDSRLLALAGGPGSPSAGVGGLWCGTMTTSTMSWPIVLKIGPSDSRRAIVTYVESYDGKTFVVSAVEAIADPQAGFFFQGTDRLSDVRFSFAAPDGQHMDIGRRWLPPGKTAGLSARGTLEKQH